jgi:hypothetical protein
VKAEKVIDMHLTSDEQELLLAGALGFVTCVALLHLSEATILAAKLRAWMPLLWSGMLFLAAVMLVWRVGTEVSHGVGFADLLAVFGGQLGLLVCLPSRWLLRRTCRWDRTRMQHELQTEWWRQAADPHQRARIDFPRPFDQLGDLGRRNQLDSRRAGVGPHMR